MESEGAVFTKDPLSHGDTGGCSGVHMAEPRRVLERAFLHIGTEGGDSASFGVSGESPLGTDAALDRCGLMSFVRSSGHEVFLLQCEGRTRIRQRRDVVGPTPWLPVRHGPRSL